MKKGKHPKTYITKVFMGSEETYICSTSVQAIMVPHPSMVWGSKKNVIIGVTPEALRSFEDI